MPYQPTWTNPYLSQYGQGMQAQFQGPSYQNAPTQFPTVSQQPVNGIVKVNGRDSALQYQLPPNSMSPALFDNNGQMFYIVSTDGTGMKTVEVFDFTPHVEQQPVQIDGAQFVSRQEYDQFVAKVSAALEVINNGVHGPVQATSGATAYGTQGPNGNVAPDDARGPAGPNYQPMPD